MRNPVIFASLALLLADQAAATEVWTCSAEQATGFLYDEESNSWAPSTFDVDGAKYSIERPNRNSAAAWEVYRLSPGKKPSMLFYCIDEIDRAGFLFCNGPTEEFRFNAEGLRYQRVSQLGFYNELPNLPSLAVLSGSDRPFIEIGTCTVEE